MNDYWMSSSAGTCWQIKGVPKTFAQWKSATTSDGSSTAHSGLPTANVIRVIQPPGDRWGKLHVAVMNWTSANNASVPVGGYFSDGDTIRVYEVGYFPTSQQDVTVSGGNVSVDLTPTNYRVPMGGVKCYTNDTWAGLPSTFKAYVLQKMHGKRKESTMLFIMK
jgi:hypothetical protein